MIDIKAIREDLLERRLWPIVAVLVIAIVAIPVALSHGVNPPPAQTPTRSDGPNPAQVVGNASENVQDALTPGPPPPDAPRDPFPNGSSDQAPVPTAAAPAATPAASTTPAHVATPVKTTKPKTTITATVRPGSPVASATTTHHTAPATAKTTATPTRTATIVPTKTTTTAKPAPTTPKTWPIRLADLRLGPTVNVPATRDAPRYMALPSPSHPAAIFLGVLSDGKRAAFALTSGVTATGGQCVSKPPACTQLIVPSGRAIPLTLPDGTHEQLLIIVRTHSTKFYAKLKHANSRYSPTGLCLVARLDSVVYDPSRGTLTPVPKHLKCSTAKTSISATATVPSTTATASTTTATASTTTTTPTTG